MLGFNYHFRQSLRHGRASLRHWYVLGGLVVTAVALLNFIDALTHIQLSSIFSQVLATYRAVFHGALDWLTSPLKFRIPPPLKDLMFVYGVIGGSFMRSRLAEGEVYPHREKHETLYDAFRILIVPSKKLRDGGIPASSRVTAMYQMSPRWMRMTLDLVFWPRVAFQYIHAPMVYFSEYSATFQTFPPGYTPGPRKNFLYDRRIILIVQFAALIAAVVSLLVVNGFLIAL